MRDARRGAERAALGIDRMVRNVETGRFERSLSALTAAGALVTAAEIFFEHDSASFGNKMMWVPVALGPVGAAAGVAGFFSRRMAKTALPVASAAIVANGLQGTYLHARGIAQKPGGWPTPATTWRWGRRCWPRCWSPWSAGWACWPRSCGGSGEPAAAAGQRPVPRLRRPAAQARHWDPVTAGVVLDRLAMPPDSGSSPRPRRPPRPRCSTSCWARPASRWCPGGAR